MLRQNFQVSHSVNTYFSIRPKYHLCVTFHKWLFILIGIKIVKYFYACESRSLPQINRIFVPLWKSSNFKRKLSRLTDWISYTCMYPRFLEYSDGFTTHPYLNARNPISRTNFPDIHIIVEMFCVTSWIEPRLQGRAAVAGGWAVADTASQMTGVGRTRAKSHYTWIYRSSWIKTL